DQEDEDRDRIDEETAGVRHQVFSAGVDDTEHERRQQRAPQAAEAPDGHHNQEQHEIKEREIRVEPEQLDRESTAERRESGAEGEGQREQAIDIDAYRFRHAAVVD